MKKIACLGFFILAFFGPTVFAEDIHLNVLNVSENNQDAMSIGARPGDILRYELQINSDQSVSNLTPEIEVKDLLTKAQIVDAGLAKQSDSKLNFPILEKNPPVSETYTFFARVNKECPSEDMRNINVSGHGQETNVKIICGLAKSGTDYKNILITFVIVLVVGIASLILKKKQTV